LAVDRQSVAQELPDGTRLIEFLRFNVFDFEAKGTDRWKPARYVAFVLPASQPDAIEMMDLGPAEQIDSMVRIFREFIGREAGETKSPHALGSAWAQDMSDIGERLRTAVVDPLMRGDRGQRMFLATDGELNLLPFEALPSKRRSPTYQYLIDEYALSYLGS